ncbi:hypothetical protein BDY24DRAFT_193627 [Mrakia frigida]|uniref:uncharacterized protein n=1 Tax=Mrakia frigida TaxID=29902 RepID=UPI003FCC0949
MFFHSPILQLHPSLLVWQRWPQSPRTLLSPSSKAQQLRRRWLVGQNFSSSSNSYSQGGSHPRSIPSSSHPSQIRDSTTSSSSLQTRSLLVFPPPPLVHPSSLPPKLRKHQQQQLRRPSPSPRRSVLKQKPLRSSVIIRTSSSSIQHIPSTNGFFVSKEPFLLRHQLPPLFPRCYPSPSCQDEEQDCCNWSWRREVSVEEER